jgi:S1-C subfamily serine protease
VIVAGRGGCHGHRDAYASVSVATADWIVIGVVLLFGFYGLSRGLVRGALSLAGFALGAYVGAQVAPALLAKGSPYAPLVALGGAILGGVLLQSLAGMLGGTLRASMGTLPGFHLVDSVAGAVLGVAAGVLICWAVGAVLLYLPFGQSELRRSVQESSILSRINEEFPPERLLETLQRVDPIGVVIGPPAIVAPPDTTIAGDAKVVLAAESVVRVTGLACGLGIEGSGWIVRPGLVVTNAHVVAGIRRPHVDRRARSGFDATVVAFDADEDLAVLRVVGLRGHPLPLANPERGTAVALVGYPGNGPLTRTPGRLGGTGKALFRDAYGRGPIIRSATAIRGAVRAGLSGGPAVDARGRVLATVFARRPGEVGGYGIPSSVVRNVLEQVGTKALSTECAR